MPQLLSAVLWDLDGTLVDSEEFHWRAWQETLERHGVRIAYQQFKSTFGQRNETFLGAWLGPDATAKLTGRVADEKEECFRRLIREQGLDGLPGAVQWVRRMRERGWKQAIASSAPRANVEVMTEALGLRQYFDELVASEDVSHGKPDPEVFLLAARRLDVPPSRCVVVEDALPGVEGARRAGMRCIGVTGADRTLGADLDVPTLAGLPDDAFENL